jgi:hypothetical protein
LNNFFKIQYTSRDEAEAGDNDETLMNDIFSSKWNLITYDVSKFLYKGMAHK